MKQPLLVIMRKIGIICFVSAFILTVGCSNENTINEPASQNESYNTEISTQNFIEQPTQTESEMSESISDVAESTVDEQSYNAYDSKSINENDYTTISQLCNEACYKWARLYNGYEESDFSEIVTINTLNTYLIQSAKNCEIIGISSSKSAEYQIDTVEYNNQFAIIKGTYIHANGADGIFIFIVENIDGKLYINDMIYDTKDTFDNLYRRDCVVDPQPNFWKDSEKYAVVLEKLANQYRAAN